MTNAEKLQKTMKEASETFQKLPAWAKTEPKASSASVERTVRPTAPGTAKK